jgi:hypothetical protein
MTQLANLPGRESRKLSLYISVSRLELKSNVLYRKRFYFKHREVMERRDLGAEVAGLDIQTRQVATGLENLLNLSEDEQIQKRLCPQIRQEQ